MEVRDVQGILSDLLQQVGEMLQWQMFAWEVFGFRRIVRMVLQRRGVEQWP
jgi:hypothetical protein